MWLSFCSPEDLSCSLRGILLNSLPPPHTTAEVKGLFSSLCLKLQSHYGTGIITERSWHTSLGKAGRELRVEIQIISSLYKVLMSLTLKLTQNKTVGNNLEEEKKECDLTVMRTWNELLPAIFSHVKVTKSKGQKAHSVSISWLYYIRAVYYHTELISIIFPLHN